MRIAIHADGVTTEALRDLTCALAVTGSEQAKIGADGDCWKVMTPKMQPAAFAGVVGKLVKVDGRTFDVYREAAQVALGELGEALMKDGEAKDACIERAIALLRGEVTP